MDDFIGKLEGIGNATHGNAGHRPTLVALERFLAPGNPVRVEVARILVPAYERSDEAKKLAGALEIILNATVDSNEELELLRRLSGAGAAAVMMSGSGPTVFGVFEDRRSASKAATIISKEVGRAVRVLVARTVSRQPGVTSWRSPRSASSPSTRRS